MHDSLSSLLSSASPLSERGGDVREGATRAAVPAGGVRRGRVFVREQKRERGRRSGVGALLRDERGREGTGAQSAAGRTPSASKSAQLGRFCDFAEGRLRCSVIGVRKVLCCDAHC